MKIEIYYHLMANQLHLDNQSEKFKRWIHTIIWILILRYTFNYSISYTFIEFMWHEKLYEYLYLGIFTIISI